MSGKKICTDLYFDEVVTDSENIQKQVRDAIAAYTGQFHLKATAMKSFSKVRVCYDQDAPQSFIDGVTSALNTVAGAGDGPGGAPMAVAEPQHFFAVQAAASSISAVPPHAGIIATGGSVRMHLQTDNNVELGGEGSLPGSTGIFSQRLASFTYDDGGGETVAFVGLNTTGSYATVLEIEAFATDLDADWVIPAGTTLTIKETSAPTAEVFTFSNAYTLKQPTVASRNYLYLTCDGKIYNGGETVDFLPVTPLRNLQDAIAAGAL